MSSASSRLRARSPIALSIMAVHLLAATTLLTGCCCGHTPTINTNASICADGHMINAQETPGNSGPLHPFTVPRQDACNGGPAVAVIDVDGILLDMDMVGPSSAGENPVSLFRERLDEAASDPCTRAVVIRINTYGGGVTASDIMRHDLEEFKNRSGLPVVACLLDTAAGGGYYLATAADQIVATPTSLVGGIGVIFNKYNLADSLRRYEISATPIKSGEHIDLGSQLRPTDLDETKPAVELPWLQGLADLYHARFKEVVLKSRPMMSPDQAEMWDGRVFSGAQAVQLHMVDALGFPDDAVRTAGGMAGLGNPRIVLYHRCNDHARSIYSITPNVPLQGQILQMNSPGLDRASLPTFLYMWEPEPTMERLGGR